MCSCAPAARARDGVHPCLRLALSVDNTARVKLLWSVQWSLYWSGMQGIVGGKLKLKGIDKKCATDAAASPLAAASPRTLTPKLDSEHLAQRRLRRGRRVSGTTFHGTV